MNLKNRLSKLEEALQPKPTGGRIVRQVGENLYAVPDLEAAVTREELETEMRFPFVILPAKAESVEQWMKQHGGQI